MVFKSFIKEGSQFIITSGVNAGIYTCISNKLSQIDNKYYKLSYQNQFLSIVFPNHGILDPISYIDMEKFPNVIISYILLLEFAKAHRIDIIERISKPKMIDNDDTLILTQNSIHQLNVVSDKNMNDINQKNISLLSILNQCNTAFGKRQFKQKLLNPITSVDTLETNYSKIENIINNNIYGTLQENLTKVLDIERMHRRMSLKVLTPNEMYNLYNSSKIIEKMKDLYTFEAFLLLIFKNYYKNIFNLLTQYLDPLAKEALTKV